MMSEDNVMSSMTSEMMIPDTTRMSSETMTSNTTTVTSKKERQGTASRLLNLVSSARRLSKSPQPAKVTLVLSEPPEGADPKFKIRAVARASGM